MQAERPENRAELPDGRRPLGEGGQAGVAAAGCLVIFQPVDFFEEKKKRYVKLKVLNFVPVNLLQ